MARTTKVGKRFPLNLAYTDAAGNAAFIDGAPAVSSSNEAVCSIVEEDGKLYAYNLSPGLAQIVAAADADLTEAENLITGVLEVEVLPGDAVLVTINAGEDEDIPAPAPEPEPEPEDPPPVDPAPVDPAPEPEA